MKSTLTVRVLCSAALLAVPVAVWAKDKGSGYSYSYSSSSKSDDDSNRKSKTIVLRGVHGSFLGIGVAEVDSDRAKELRLKEERGVEVKSVEDDSPAAKAGMKEDDVVLEFNGERVEGSAQFIRMVRETPPGRQVKIVVWRDGGTHTLTATIEKRKPKIWRWKSGDDKDDDNQVLVTPGERDDDDSDTSDAPEAFHFDMPDIDIPEVHIPDLPNMNWRTPRLGIETEGLGGQLAEYFGVKEGVLVRSVVKNSAAERAGLKAGDVITKIDGEKVAASGEISSALRSLGTGKSFNITIVRNGREMSLNAKLDEAKRKSEMILPHGIRQNGVFFRPFGMHVYAPCGIRRNGLFFRPFGERIYVPRGIRRKGLFFRPSGARV